MNFPIWLKYIWWSLLLLFVSGFLFVRSDQILTSEISTVDLIILIFWIALVALPIVNEVNIFGFGLKNKIEQVERNIKNELSTLKLDLNNVLNSSIQANQSFTLNMNPTNEDLEKLIKNIEIGEENTIKTKNKKNIQDLSIPEASDDTLYLMNVMRVLEIEVKRIFFELTGQEEPKFITPNKIVRVLQYQYGVLQFPITDILLNILRICSVVVNGEEVEQTKIDFVKRFAPKVFHFLKQITASNLYPPKPDTSNW